MALGGPACSQPPLLSCMVMSVSGLTPTGQGPLHMLTKQQQSQQQQEEESEVDEELLTAALPCLLAEWVYWNTGPKAVHVVQGVPTGSAPGTDSVNPPGGSQTGRSPVGSPGALMSRYWADWEEPRPESYRCRGGICSTGNRLSISMGSGTCTPS
jgi:hypothetical protein